MSDPTAKQLTTAMLQKSQLQLLQNCHHDCDVQPFLA